MVLKISQVIEPPVISEVPHRETKTFHLSDKIVIDDPPLPNVMNVPVYAPLLILWTGVNFVHFFKRRFVGFFVLRVWDVPKILFFSEIKEPDGTPRSSKLRIEN